MIILKTLNLLLSNKDRFPDVQYGIKLCGNNLGFNGKIYTIPSFCAFLLKKWLMQKKGE